MKEELVGRKSPVRVSEFTDKSFRWKRFQWMHQSKPKSEKISLSLPVMQSIESAVSLLQLLSCVWTVLRSRTSVLPQTYAHIRVCSKFLQAVCCSKETYFEETQSVFVLSIVGARRCKKCAQKERNAVSLLHSPLLLSLTRPLSILRIYFFPPAADDRLCPFSGRIVMSHLSPSTVPPVHVQQTLEGPLFCTPSA